MPSLIHRARHQQRRALLFLCTAAPCLFPAAAHAALTFLNAWGSTGSGNSQFKGPVAPAVAPNGNVYVTDPGNDRVQYFSSTGAFLGSFGTAGTGLGQLESPADVAVDAAGTVYVVDAINNDVQSFGPGGGFLGSFGTDTNDKFGYAFGVAVDRNGNVYASDFNSDRVEIFNHLGALVSTFGSPGGANGDFNAPGFLAFGPTGLVYVPDTGNNRVEIFSSTGVYQSTFRNTGDFAPVGVAVGPTGIVYVTDIDYPRVEVFSSTGVYQSTFGTKGTGNGQFENLQGIAVSPNGMVYVTDEENNQVQRLFDPDSWTSGTNAFTDPSVGPTSVTVGAGQILGTSLTLTSSMGLTVGATLAINSGGTLTQSGGNISTSRPVRERHLHLPERTFKRQLQPHHHQHRHGRPQRCLHHLRQRHQQRPPHHQRRRHRNLPRLLHRQHLHHQQRLPRLRRHLLHWRHRRHRQPHPRLKHLPRKLAPLRQQRHQPTRRPHPQLLLATRPQQQRAPRRSPRRPHQIRRHHPTRPHKSSPENTAGAWNGPGIISGTARAAAAHISIAVADNAVLGYTTFDGQPVDANSIIIVPALFGDANLDDTVDLNDLNTVLNNLGTTTAAWSSGNFDGATTIDLTDLNEVLNHLDTSIAGTNASPATPAPEPASLAILLAGFPLLLAKPRRRSPRRACA